MIVCNYKDKGTEIKTSWTGYYIHNILQRICQLNGYLFLEKDIFDRLKLSLFFPQQFLDLLVYFVKLMRYVDGIELLFLKEENNLFQ